MAQSEIILGGLPYGADIVVGEELEVGTFTIGGTTYTRYVKAIKITTELPTTTTAKAIGSLGETYIGVLGLSGLVASTNTMMSLPLPYAGYDGTDVLSIGIFMQGDDIYMRTSKANFLTAYDSTIIFVEYYR